MGYRKCHVAIPNFQICPTICWHISWSSNTKFSQPNGATSSSSSPLWETLISPLTPRSRWQPPTLPETETAETSTNQIRTHYSSQHPWQPAGNKLQNHHSWARSTASQRHQSRSCKHHHTKLLQVQPPWMELRSRSNRTMDSLYTTPEPPRELHVHACA